LEQAACRRPGTLAVNVRGVRGEAEHDRARADPRLQHDSARVEDGDDGRCSTAPRERVSSNSLALHTLIRLQTACGHGVLDERFK
jgi:hypothetical protein